MTYMTTTDLLLTMPTSHLKVTTIQTTNKNTPSTSIDTTITASTDSGNYSISILKYFVD